MATTAANTLLVVTGASRGLGRAISIAFANPKWKSEISALRAVLIGRNQVGLNDTKGLMMAEATVPLSVSCHCLDLANLDNLEISFDSVLSTVKSQQYERCIFINNAGILEPIGLVAENHLSFDQMRRHVDLNITSGLFVSSYFARHFINDSSSTYIINISSAVAVQPFLTMGMYCASKAARDMYHAVLAQEHIGDTRVKVLNYAPGPCATDMSEELCNSQTLDPELQKFFRQAKQNNTAVQPKDTADKLAQLILQSTFESGSHVDFYDI
jgi:sepiapterin reductase